ncbi:MAG: DCC1-like thiol-disulfide oxidoreductase family protein [Pseudorhodoplanes sp.]
MISPDDPQLTNVGQTGGPALILYDGDCVLCSGWFRFVAQRDAERKFLFTAIQSPYGRALAIRNGIDPDHPQSNAVLIDGTVNLKSDSAIAAISNLPHYGWVRMFLLLPKSVRDPLYSMIARNRYNWFGRNETCWLGGAHYADRVIG